MSKLITNFNVFKVFTVFCVFFSRNFFRCLAPFSNPLNEFAPGPRAIRSHPPFDIRCPAHPKWCVPSLFLHCSNYCNCPLDAVDVHLHLLVVRLWELRQPARAVCRVTVVGADTRLCPCTRVAAKNMPALATLHTVRAVGRAAPLCAVKNPALPIVVGQVRAPAPLAQLKNLDRPWCGWGRDDDNRLRRGSSSRLRRGCSSRQSRVPVWHERNILLLLPRPDILLIEIRSIWSR